MLGAPCYSHISNGEHSATNQYDFYAEECTARKFSTVCTDLGFEIVHLGNRHPAIVSGDYTPTYAHKSLLMDAIEMLLVA